MKKFKNKISGFFKEFKDFATKGNVLDLAIGVIIGGAFGKIVSSLVADMILPLVGLAMGGINISDLKWVITPAVIDSATGLVVKAEAALLYGSFLQTILDFIIIAFTIFMLLKILMSAKDMANKATEAVEKYIEGEKKEENATEEVEEIPAVVEEEIPAIVEESPESEKIIKVLEEIKELLKAAKEAPTK